MSDSLKSKTARSAVFIIKESITALRHCSTNLDKRGSFDNILKECEQLSTGLKKLGSYVDIELEPPRSGQVTKKGEFYINPVAVLNILTNEK